MATIVVLGARGRLGVKIANTAASAGTTVMAVASAPSPAWRPEVMHHRFARDAPASEPRRVFEQADVAIVVAPLASCDIHTLALECSCHVVDVTIAPDQVLSVLGLNEQAQNSALAVIAAAGLAPGLTGLLGKAVLEQAGAESTVDVCLTQSAEGTAGEQGTREMLEMLTRRDGSDTCHLLGHESSSPERVRAFVLPTPESELATATAIRYYTRFDQKRLNRNIRFLAGIRATIPALYRSLRNSTARRKAVAARPVAEPIVLSAVAINATDEPLAWRTLHLSSDYAATAAVAVGTALAATRGSISPGAGMLAEVADLSSVLGYRQLQDVMIENRGG